MHTRTEVTMIVVRTLTPVVEEFIYTGGAIGAPIVLTVIGIGDFSVCKVHSVGSIRGARGLPHLCKVV